jgi:uroporphyrinogen-III decarboxylase
LAFEAAAMLRDRHPEAVIRIPVGGPFSIASTLMGFDNLLCDSLTDGDAVRAALVFLARQQLVVARAAAAKGFDVVLFDSAATPPLLSPGLFRDLVLPALQVYREGLRDIVPRGSRDSAAPSLIMGGDTALVLDYLVSLDPGFLICPAETDQRAFMEALRGRPGIGVRLNMNVSALMDPDERVAESEAVRVATLALETSVPGRPVLIGTGVLPVDADPARIRRLGELVSRL